MSAPVPSRRGPLFEQQPVLRSSDLQESCCRVGEVLAPHELRLRKPRARLRTRFNCAHLSPGAAMTFLEYGTPVDVHPGFMNDKYLLEIPLHGGADVQIGHQRVAAAAGVATIVSPTEYFKLHMSARCAFLSLVLDQRLVLDTLAGLGAAEVIDAPVFEPTLGATPQARALLAGVWALARALERGEAGPRQAEILAEQLLVHQPHDHSRLLAAAAPAKAAATVGRAREYVRAHLAEPISLGDLCRATATPARTLRANFVRVLGCPPKDYIEAERLARVHADLRRAREGETVTEIALRWGVTHLARFAGCYRRRYGLYPSETLRGRRAGP